MTFTRSDRGFMHGPDIDTDYGHVVRVYESSAASEPCIWLGVSGRVHADPGSITDWIGSAGVERAYEDGSANVHMTLDMARAVHDSLGEMIEFMETRNRDWLRDEEE